MTGATIKKKDSTMETHGHPACPVTAKAQEYARDTVQKAFVDSVIEDRTGNYPKFEFSELQLGKVLGKGGFGTVSEIRAFVMNGKKVQVNTRKGFSDDLEETEYYDPSNTNSSSDATKAQQDARTFIAQHCLRNNSDARYAIKMLSPEVVKDKGMFVQGMMDMALETRFMCDMEHPNIVKIRAMAQCDPFHAEYFLVMDRLYDTLERRIQKVWLPKHKRQKSFLGKAILDRKGEKKDALFEERIVYAFDLAAAINYLHQRKILYRDLKPENIGYVIYSCFILFLLAALSQFRFLILSVTLLLRHP